MKTLLLVALCAILALFSCSKDIKKEIVQSHFFTFQTVIEETSDSHQDYFVLHGQENQVIPLSESVAHEIALIAPNGSTLEIFSNNIPMFLKTENFDLSQVRIRNTLNAEQRNSNKRFLAVMVSTPTHPCQSSVEEVKDILFNSDIKSKSLNAFYSLQSNGNIRFGGDVVELDINLSQVSLMKLIQECEEPLGEEGIHYDNYDHVCFMTDKTRPYLGVAFLDGKYSHVDKSSSKKALIHEIGHNMGMHHSTKLLVSGGVQEYGDQSCIMGGRLREINALHRLNMGWMENQNIYALNRPAKNIKIFPLGLDLSNSDKDQVLLLESPDDKYTLTASMRTDYNVFDQSMSSSFVKKLCIHRNYNSGKTLLVDVLNEGESYYSADLRTTIIFSKLDNVSGCAVVDLK